MMVWGYKISVQLLYFLYLLMGTAKQAKVFPETKSMPQYHDQSKPQTVDSVLQLSKVGKTAQREMRKRSVGLTNEGNTCFINSALQCLFNIKEFAQHYQEESQHSSPIQKQMARLVRMMWSGGESQENDIFDMGQFYREIRNGMELYQLNRYRQMDATEFIQNFLNHIRSTHCTQKNGQKDWMRSLFMGKFHTVITCKEKCFQDGSECNAAIVDIKEDYLALPLTVVEQTEPIFTYQPYWYRSWSNSSMRYNLNRKKENIRLDDCLTKFSKESGSDEGDRWFCRLCKKEALCSKKMDIYSVNEVLIIHLLRFSGSSKYMGTIEYPEQLQEYEITKQEDHISVQYQLVGVICHLGYSISCGHYVSYTRDQHREEWFRQSDRSAYRVQNGEWLNHPDAYVLFYRRMH